MKKQEKIYKVYEITNTINKDVYVGATSLELEERFAIHAMHLKSDCSNIANRSEMYEDMMQYGIDKFSIKLLHGKLPKDHALKIEKDYQKYDKRCRRYAERDLKRDRRSKFNSCYKLIGENEVLYFKKGTEIAKKFNCHRTNVTRSANDGYLFLKKYFIRRISHAEYENSLGVGSLFS